jgi:DNA-binding XRE family transcriptional regulator
MTDDAQMSIGDRVKVLRVMASPQIGHGMPLTQEKFSEIFKRSKTSAANWEVGNNGVPWQVAVECKKRFGVTTDWIYLGDRSGLSGVTADRIDAAKKHLHRLKRPLRGSQT